MKCDGIDENTKRGMLTLSQLRANARARVSNMSSW